MTDLSVSDGQADHKLVRTMSLDLLVKRPAESAEQIRSLTEHVGGFLVKWQTNGAQDATDASLTIRVPAARFAEVGAEIRKLGLRVENEQMEAAGCWSHTRRKFIDAEKVAPEIAREAVDLMDTFFRLERQARGFSVEDRLALRQAHSVPVIEKLQEKLLDWKQQLLPKHPMAEAVNYP